MLLSFPCASWDIIVVRVVLTQKLAQANPIGEVVVSAPTAKATQEANARKAAALARQASCYA